jgi:hypothetical protein
MLKNCIVCNNVIKDRHGNAKKCLLCDYSFAYGRGKAHRLVHKAIVKGELKPPYLFSCVDCGLNAIFYEHRDYNKPLDVVPVCRMCNIKRGSAIPLALEKVKIRKIKNPKTKKYEIVEKPTFLYHNLQ